MVRFSPTAFCYWALCFLPFLVVGVSAACTWETHAGMSSAEGASAGDSTTTAEDCKELCNADSTCIAVLHDTGGNPKCKTFDAEPSDLESNILFGSKTYYNKSCTEACTMVSSTALTATTQVSVDIQATADTCKALCKMVSECVAISFDGTTSTSMCIIHTSAATSSFQSGYVFASKTVCSDGGPQCCFSDNVDRNGTSSTSYKLDLNQPLESCKTMCVHASQCVSLSFSDTTCDIHNASQSTNSQSSSDYTKSCSGGILTIVVTCGAETIQLSKLLGVWLVVIVVARL